MIEINKLLRRHDICACKYQKKDDLIIIDSTDKQYIITKKNTNNKIFKYLDNRNFKYYPQSIDNYNDYRLYDYMEDIDIPREQKMTDLMKFIALLHAKTTYYKTIDDSNYKELYEDISNNVQYLKEYYNDIITLIDEKIFYSPYENLFANNISLFFNALDYCEEEIKNWYNNIQNYNKVRVSVVHNNLKLSNFIQNDSKYLINWEKAKIDLPIFDLYKLYLNHYMDFDFIELLNVYEASYKLKEEEKTLLLILISLPKKITLVNNSYTNCVIIKNEIKRLYKSKEIVKCVKNKKNEQK